VNYGTVELTASPEEVVEVVRTLREDPSLACEYFDFLSAVDWMDEGFEVLVVMTSIRHGPTVCVKVRLAAEDPHMPTLTGVFRGADWHERETAEMFGIRFDGHHNLVKLYLPEDFEGYPLRKSFALASRVYKPWPGEKEFEKQ
jgi:NADH-quinone oxidoreductase subunit C